MFSLKTTELKPSRIGLVLLLFMVGSGLLLLNLYWMPARIRASLIIFVVVLVLFFVFYRMHQPFNQIGIDELGAFLCERGEYSRLDFVRFNSVQLIAKKRRDNIILNFLFPSYRIIYRDSVSYENYRLLRSFAAQQIMLRHSEEAKKHF